MPWEIGSMAAVAYVVCIWSLKKYLTKTIILFFLLRRSSFNHLVLYPYNIEDIIKTPVPLMND